MANKRKSPPASPVEVEYTKLFIDNKWVDAEGGATLEVEDPSTGEVVCEVASASVSDIDAAVASCRKAFEIGSEWRTMDASQRGELLYRLADLIERDREQLARLETLDNGKPYSTSFNVDLGLVIKTFRYYAGWADKIQGKTIPTDGPFFTYTRHEPVGVVGAIVPWNFPLMMVAWKLAPALCCGNVVLLKPAEQTPLTALHVGALVAEAGFPPGVVNVCVGLGRTAGAAISSHMHIDKVAFTGSTLIGRLIATAAAQSNLKRVTLELGGKSPAIVFSDYGDLDAAVEMAHHAIYFNQGQCCCAGSRTYVQDEIYDEFVRKSVARARSRVVGDPFEAGVEHGPQVNKMQFDKILSMIQDGVKQGARVACGGKAMRRPGYFIEPTVLADVQQDNVCAREEIFGPVQVIIRFKTMEEVIERANDSPYGLAAAVLTSSIDKAMQVSHQIRAGTVWVNCYDILEAQCPFGGYKQSGAGRELGEYGLQQYSEVKTVTIRIPVKNS
eukprot:g356.t1